MFIASEPVVHKLKWERKLLIDNLIPTSAKPLRQPAGKPKLRKKLKKRAQIKTEYNKPVILEKNLAAKRQLKIKVGNLYNLLV